MWVWRQYEEDREVKGAGGGRLGGVKIVKGGGGGKTGV